MPRIVPKEFKESLVMTFIHSTWSSFEGSFFRVRAVAMKLFGSLTVDGNGSSLRKGSFKIASILAAGVVKPVLGRPAKYRNTSRWAGLN